jgi:hypothetical protein
MISLDDAARQITGAWKMSFAADDWRQSLDRSENAVFASFWAMAMTAPFVVLLSVLSFRAALKLPGAADFAALRTPLPALASADLASFAIEWIAGLAFLLFVARAGGAGARAATLIVGYNWIQPITIIAHMPAIAIMAATGNAGLGGIFGLPSLALSVALYWGVLRRGLETGLGQTVALISALFIIGLTLDAAAGAILAAMFST